MIETRLIMGFNDKDKKLFNLTMRDADSSLESDAVMGAMDKIVAANVFQSKGYDLESRQTAKLVKTETVKLF